MGGWKGKIKGRMKASSDKLIKGELMKFQREDLMKVMF